MLVSPHIVSTRYRTLTVFLKYSTWKLLFQFLLTDDVRGKYVFVHTSLSAAPLYVSPWRLFDCSDNVTIHNNKIHHRRARS